MTGKRIAALVLTAMLLLGLSACGETPEETLRQPVIGVCFRQENDPQTLYYRQMLETALTQVGFAVETSDGKNDQAGQNAQIQRLIEQNCDLLIVEPVMVSEAEEIIARLRQADIPVVLINREPEQAALESWARVSFVGGDAAQPGLLQGQIILELPDHGDINDDGVVSYIVLAGPEDHLDAQLRTESCVKALTAAGIETDLLSLESGDWSRESGRKLCAKALAAYGMDVEVVFCNNDAMALGALEAIQDSGWTVGQDMYLVGIDAEAEAMEMVRQGRMTGTILTDSQAQVNKVLAVVRQLLAGESVEHRYYIDNITVTSQNVETFLQVDS